MTFEDQLEAFFDEDIETVIDDGEKFKKQLDIGADAYKILSRADHIHSGTSAVLGGAGVAGATYAGWLTSLGALGKFGMLIGVVTTPAGVMLAGGLAGAGGMYLTKRLLDAVRRDAVQEIPHFINTPIDALGTSIADIIIPILLKLAAADGTIHDAERKVIESYLVESWGFDEHFIHSAIDIHQSKIAEWDWSVLANLIERARETGDINVDKLKEKLLVVAREVAEAEGGIVAAETTELAALQASLNGPSMQEQISSHVSQARELLESGASAIRDSISKTGTYLKSILKS